MRGTEDTGVFRRTVDRSLRGLWIAFIWLMAGYMLLAGDHLGAWELTSLGDHADGVFRDTLSHAGQLGVFFSGIAALIAAFREKRR